MSLRALEQRIGLALGVALVAPACTPTPRANEPSAEPSPTRPATPAVPSPVATALAKEPVSAQANGEPLDCSLLSCRRFESASEAFEVVLQRGPTVLAIGESHKQRGDPEVDSVTRRFTEELLPALRGRATDLVVEAMEPPSGCQQQEEQVRQQQQEVTEPQDSNNQNEYLLLAQAAKQLGITPYPLRPSCDDLEKLATAGEQAVVRGLELIAELFIRQLRQLRERRPEGSLLLSYGGLIHNDLAPREGRESWVFTPALVDDATGPVVELDLIVPELIKHTEAWKALPWYGPYQALSDRTSAVLLQTGSASFTLVFPASSTRPSSHQPEPARAR